MPFSSYTQGSQSTLIAPHVELPQSWMNFSMEKTRQVIDRSAILGMTALELVVSHWVPGDPADMSNTDHIAVHIGLKDAGAAQPGRLSYSHSPGS